VTRATSRVTFDPQTGQFTAVASPLPDYVPARCPTCGAILLRVKLAGGWASVCAACHKVTGYRQND